MPKVTILRRPLERDDQTTGVGVYSDMVEDELDLAGVEHERIVVNMSVRYGYRRCLMDGFVGPFIASLNSKSDVYHATDEFCCFYFPLVKGRKVVTFHHISGGMEGRSPLYMLFWKFISKMATKRADAIIAVSEQTKNELVKDYGVPHEKIRVLTHMSPQKLRNLGLPRERVIGCVSSLIERKNVAGAIRAFKLFTEMSGTEGFRFVVCGTGPLQSGLEKLADNLGIGDRVEFVSGLSQEELERFYNTMCVYANPSMHEGLGLTPLEAQACGAPVVSFADADISEEVSKHYVKSLDEAEFAKNMHGLVFNAEFREAIISEIEKDIDFKKKYMEKLFDVYFG